MTHDALLHFYEAQENAEEMEDTKMPASKPSKKRKSSGNDESQRTNKRTKGKDYCKRHGYCSHTTEECKELKREARETKRQKRDDSKQSDNKSKGGKFGHGLTVKQHCTLVQHAVAKALKAKDKKRKAESEAFCAQLDELDLKLGEIPEHDEESDTGSVSSADSD